MSRASCRHVMCATDVSLTVVLIAASVVGWISQGTEPKTSRAEENWRSTRRDKRGEKFSVTWVRVHLLQLMHQYRTTTTTWRPSSDSRYWTWQKYLRSWQHLSVSTSMSRSPLLYRYLMRIQSFEHWIQKQSHLWWVSVAALLSRLLRKQQSPVNLSILPWVCSVKSTEKTCRPCFHLKWLHQDHPCSLLIRTLLHYCQAATVQRMNSEPK